MAVNHLDVKASLFYVFTGQERFYISAAEGFYFLSGLVLGLVAARQPLERMLRSPAAPPRAALRPHTGCFHRIYPAWADRAAPVVRPATGNPHRPGAWQPTSGAMLSLQNAFHGGEILALYVILLLGAIPALWACANGKSWPWGWFR